MSDEDYSLDQRLISAIRMTAAGAVEALIKEGAKPNLRLYFGLTALVLAVKTRHVPTVKVLTKAIVAQGLSLDEEDDDHNTALIQAVSMEQGAMVDCLLEAGADIDYANTEGTTPIMCAVRNNSPTMVDQLLRHGAAPNPAPNEVGGTPVMMATYSGFLEVLKVLDRHGVDLSEKSPSGRWAMSYAALGDREDCLEYLLKALKDHPQFALMCEDALAIAKEEKCTHCASLLERALLKIGETVKHHSPNEDSLSL